MSKRTKIICTLGPASESTSVTRDMVKAGMHVARLNFSHGDYVNHAMLIRNVRAISKKLKERVFILQDLQGPKIRVMELKKPLKVKKGQTVIIGKDFNIDSDISKNIKPGNRVLIQDGLIELKVHKVESYKVYCKVMNSGVIQSHKGVNLPDTKLQLPSLTGKDLKDLAWGLKKGVDWIAVSFVRTAKDVQFTRNQIKQLLPKGSFRPKVVAKIEKPEAIKNINAIIKASDVIMIARGDLGVEMPEEQLPGLQRKIIKLCHQAKKPVIVATQMLESMVTNPRPTRAEVSDVADAVLEGANYVMLSEESAFGRYPVEAVSEMHKIIKETLKHE